MTVPTRAYIDGEWTTLQAQRDHILAAVADTCANVTAMAEGFKLLSDASRLAQDNTAKFLRTIRRAAPHLMGKRRLRERLRYLDAWRYEPSPKTYPRALHPLKP